MARILIIEDEAATLMLMKRVLAGGGHEILTATDGPSASAMILSDVPFDLIMTDLTLPGAPSGLDLLRLMRSARTSCPVVVISGYSDEETFDSCRKVGVHHFLPKPFEIAALRQFVGEILSAAPRA